MNASRHEGEASSSRFAPANKPELASGLLPPAVEAALWRGNEIGQRIGATISSGWDALNDELPGGGWPCQSLTELLTPQPSLLEWRLLGPALRQVVNNGGQIVVVGPPKHPHLPGLLHEGIDERHLVWIQAEAPSERLWAVEQLVKGNAAGALLAWLPQARQDQLRRVQVCAQVCDGLVFLMRPLAARHEASPAPLRVWAAVGMDWELRLQLLKRRGPAHEGTLLLPSIPGGLASVLTPRLRRPSQLFSPEVVTDAVGRAVAPSRSRQHVTAI